jgi:hypothetical protein
VIVPADRRGPVRVRSHNLTSKQAAAAIKALGRSLPDRWARQRLTNWASQARSRMGQKPKKRRHGKGESCCWITWAVTVTVHANNSNCKEALFEFSSTTSGNVTLCMLLASCCRTLQQQQRWVRG